MAGGGSANLSKMNVYNCAISSNDAVRVIDAHCLSVQVSIHYADEPLVVEGSSLNLTQISRMSATYPKSKAEEHDEVFDLQH